MLPLDVSAIQKNKYVIIQNNLSKLTIALLVKASKVRPPTKVQILVCTICGIKKNPLVVSNSLSLIRPMVSGPSCMGWLKA
jgi:hypothetical protein